MPSVTRPDNGRSSAVPYLSLVATARNDDHGGNLLGRMQIFVDAWIRQAQRHHLDCELILVEWNPPAGRARLTEALRWPQDTAPCRVRIIEVPPEVHATFRHAAALPLYQMIAKNVGIRRARGEYVLATNIDVVFSDEMMAFLASRTLEKGRMYRVDRTDVGSDVPAAGTLDEQLAYCRSHVIRLCTREGIFHLTPDGLRATEARDMVEPDAGLNFGRGWYGVERFGSGEPFRWIDEDAELVVSRAQGGLLVLEVEPGPGLGPAPHLLRALNEGGDVVAEWKIEGRDTLELVVPPPLPGQRRIVRLVSPDSGYPVPNDPRILSYRVFHCDWARAGTGAPPASFRTVIGTCRPTLRRMVGAGGIASLAGPRLGALRRAVRLLRERGSDVFAAGAIHRLGKGWHELEDSGGERYRWLEREAEFAIHLPQGHANLTLLLEPGPSLGFQPFTLEARLRGGAVVGRVPVSGITCVDIPLSATGLNEIELGAKGGGKGATGPDSRTLAFRVFACSLGGAVHNSVAAREAGDWPHWKVASQPREIAWEEMLHDAAPQIAAMGKPRYLHLFACGDFTLMAREDWFDIRGYAELDQFSMHLDSILCYTAHHAGVVETLLPDALKIYHIEHGVGSGWTPEGESALYARIARKGISAVSFDELTALIRQMRFLQAPVIFNTESWGMSKHTLAEWTPQPATVAAFQ